jgi:hypothetical protein
MVGDLKVRPPPTKLAKLALARPPRPARVTALTMKKSLSTTVLTLLTAICAMTAAGFCLLHLQYTREIRSIQGQFVAVNNNRANLNRLATELLEYSKTHPDIKPLLETVGLKEVKP